MLTDKDLESMAKYFLKKYFGNLPEIPCIFEQSKKFDKGDRGVFLMMKNDNYEESEDELATWPDYKSKHINITHMVGFDIPSEAWTDPENHPDIGIAIIEDLANEPIKCTAILLHELVHYYCWYTGLDHKDGAAQFEKKLKEMGLPSNSSHKYDNNLKEWVDGFDYEPTEKYYYEYVDFIKTNDKK